MKTNQLSFLWAVAGAYLIYLGAKQFIALFDDSASIPWLNALCGIIFILFGGAVVLREWRNYRRGPVEEQFEDTEVEGEEEV